MKPPAATPNLESPRARKARLSQRIGHNGYELLLIASLVFGAAAAYGWLGARNSHLGYGGAALGLLALMLALWYALDLRDVPPQTPAASLDGIINPALLARLRPNLTPRTAWRLLLRDPAAQFVFAHLLIDATTFTESISDDPQAMPAVWQAAAQLAAGQDAPELDGGALAAALMLATPAVGESLAHYKMKPEDLVAVFAWLERQKAYERQPKPNFGGIGRDWATGFTPTLDHFGQNISLGIEHGGGFVPFIAHADLVPGIVNNLSRGAAVALVGQAGTGKTSLVYGLADQLLRGRHPELRYYKVVALNASMIISAAGGQLESLLLSLFSEAIAAGNIIIFLDEAQLFFGNGTGAFDLGQLLLPILQNHRLKVIAALTPNDWQRLRAANESLSAHFVSINIPEPDAGATYKVIEDEALLIGHRNNALVTFEAVREAYRLSGQYMQEFSYPGKAITLLEQALPYADGRVVTAETVQTAVEKTRGVRVSTAGAPEADMLLHLEDRIHERMINQTRAVTVVADALRRGRAGVGNPKRPVGSFLFLGPTGVGKTELARSLAAVYFGDEHQMIRLDMSEYQRPEDVARLLDGGGQGASSLLMAVREQPFSVVLLDEIEKAHPNILNLLLQLLDEGQLTDNQGRAASFRSAIIIATSNAGAVDITSRVRAGSSLEDFERPLIDKLIREGQFRPELINRFDEVVLFRPLNENELAQVAQLMLAEVNRTLAAQNIGVELSDEALRAIARAGFDPEFGARPMRRMIQKTVENAVATRILRGEATPGQTIRLDVGDLRQADPALAATQAQQPGGLTSQNMAAPMPAPAATPQLSQPPPSTPPYQPPGPPAA